MKFFPMNKIVLLCVLIVPYTMLALLPLIQPTNPEKLCNRSIDAGIKAQPPQIPDLHILAAISGGQAMPTPEQVEEERGIEEEQVALAGEWLTDQDPRQRVIGAEQLSAYPTAKAGDYLLNALKNDPSAEVRSAAAESLGFFESSEENILDSLIGALPDGDATVRSTALSSLQVLLNRNSDNRVVQERIERKLKELTETRSLPGDMREVIQSYLDDSAVSLE